MGHYPDRIDVEELVERLKGLAAEGALIHTFSWGLVVSLLSDAATALSALEKERDEARSELSALKALVGRMAEGLEEVTDALEAEVKARADGELPRRIARDLEPVVRARSLLSEAKGLER